MNRRHALCCAGALAAGLFTSLLAPASATLSNPCLGTVPDELLQHDLVRSAFEGLDARYLVDTHAHLLGNGDSGSGCAVHANAHDWRHPLEVMRRKVILNAACVNEAAPSVDRAYVDRLAALAHDFPVGARWWLFAFSKAYDSQGRERDDWSTFYVPDAYAAQVAAAHPGRFDWVASVHPYRPDALACLDRAVEQGAVAVKWLPSAMNIDLRDARCRPFYDRLALAGLPLIVHGGEEKAVPGAEQSQLGNPLHVRYPLAQGVRVIMAHAASLGVAADIDRRSAPVAPAFDLFARLMAEASSHGLLVGDISAVFQRNRDPAVWHAILRRSEWHDRLLNGSDYPLPGVVPLVQPAQLVREGLLAASAVPTLERIREHNPLLFDFVLKRHVQAGTQGLPAAIFEGQRLFTSSQRPLQSPLA